MMLPEIKDWITVNSSAPCVESIKSEIMLIEYYESTKHNHFTAKALKKSWIEWKQIATPEMRSVMMLKIQLIAKVKFNINIEDDDDVSDDFFRILAIDAKEKIPRIRQSVARNRTIDHDIDDQGHCEHDRDLNSRIALSMEYIVGLINKQNGK